MKIAVLSHLVWDAGDNPVELEQGVSVCPLRESKVQSLCKQISREDEDYYSFGTADDLAYIMISEDVNDELFPYFNSPHSILSEIRNLLTILTFVPFSPCMVLTSKDEFESVWVKAPVGDFNDITELLNAGLDGVSHNNHEGSVNLVIVRSRHGVFTSDVASMFTKCHSILSKLSSDKGLDNHRVYNAFCYFFYSWNAHSIEHLCINLSVVIESLFSPASQQEVSHQTSFNFSRFMGGDRNEMFAHYDLLKKFYGLRSKIVHGGKVDSGELYLIVPRVFFLCLDAMLKILSNEVVAAAFSSSKNRDRMFKEWIF